jgi:hypothetical protein
VPVEPISRSILVLRGQPVILDRGLTAIHGARTGRFNEAVKRYTERFPEDFVVSETSIAHWIKAAATVLSENAATKSQRIG